MACCLEAIVWEMNRQCAAMLCSARKGGDEMMDGGGSNEGNEGLVRDNVSGSVKRAKARGLGNAFGDRGK